MNVSTITEAGASLIYRGLKLAEADIIKFRTSAEGRGYKHTVEECNNQLTLLRGNALEPGLFAQFAPQMELDATQSNGDGQLALDAGDSVRGTLVEVDEVSGEDGAPFEAAGGDDEEDEYELLDDGGSDPFRTAADETAGTVTDDDVPVNSETEQGTLVGTEVKRRRAVGAKRTPGAAKPPAKEKKSRGRPKGSKTTKKTK